MNKVDVNLPVWADTTTIGPLAISRLTSSQAVQLIRSAILMHQRLDIAICNAHTTLTALDDPQFAKTLQKMTLLNDGVGVNIASHYLNGTCFPENLNGTDLIPTLLAEVGTPLRIYLLGASEDRVTQAKRHIVETYPQHKVVGCRNGYFDLADSVAICEGINSTGADLLLVGMGNPRQENFIVQNREHLNATVAVGVGALFDFLSGSVIRAPRAVQAVGLEWLFRFLLEPRRLFRRYVIGIPRFLFALWTLKRKQP